MEISLIIKRLKKLIKTSAKRLMTLKETTHGKTL